MSAQHTPGPWEFEDLGEEGDNLRINQWERMEANKVAIAIIPVGYKEPFDSEQRANARLILAAPELLESLQAVVAIADRDTDVFIKARAVLAKVTGHV